MSFKFPWTNYHELNLDWILKKLEELFEASNENVETIESYEGRLTTVEGEVVTIGGNAAQALQIATGAQSLAETAQQTGQQALAYAQTAQSTAAGAINASATAIQESQTARQEAQQAVYIAQNTSAQLNDQIEALQTEAAAQIQAIDEKADNAIAEIENTVDDVIASIPSDYSSLTAQVDSIENRIDGGEEIELVLINGSINSSGVITTGGNRWISDDYIEVKSSMYCTNNTNANIFIDYYDFSAPDTYTFRGYQQIASGATSPLVSAYTHFRLYAYSTAATTEQIVLYEYSNIGVNTIDNERSVHTIPFYLLAHRGMSTQAPPNTLPAFAMAAKKGFSHIETDLRWTSDNVPVLLHDSSINRTARNPDGSAITNTIYINDITYQDALQYDFGIAFGAGFAGTKIPTLYEALLLCRQLNIDMFLEYKQTGGVTAALHTIVLNAIKDYGMMGHVHLQSFHWRNLFNTVTNSAWVRGMTGLWYITSASDITVTPSDNDQSPEFVVEHLAREQTALMPCGIQWNNNYLNTTIADYVTESGLSLGAFTIDNVETFKTLNSKVSAVTTNSVTFEDIENSYI